MIRILTDRVYIYPTNRVKIVWKFQDFCTEGPL